MIGGIDSSGTIARNEIGIAPCRVIFAAINSALGVTCGCDAGTLYYISHVHVAQGGEESIQRRPMVAASTTKVRADEGMIQLIE